MGGVGFQFLCYQRNPFKQNDEPPPNIASSDEGVASRKWELALHLMTRADELGLGDELWRMKQLMLNQRSLYFHLLQFLFQLARWSLGASIATGTNLILSRGLKQVEVYECVFFRPHGWFPLGFP